MALSKPTELNIYINKHTISVKIKVKRKKFWARETIQFEMQHFSYEILFGGQSTTRDCIFLGGREKLGTDWKKSSREWGQAVNSLY